MNYLFFDTETTGLPKDGHDALADVRATRDIFFEMRRRKQEAA
jgi:DNA polymerase III epsilon subunit-like protein